MSDPTSDLAGLRPAERDRLDAFARAIDLIDAYACRTLADVAVSEDARAAQQRAIGLMGGGPRLRAILAAVGELTEAGSRVYGAKHIRGMQARHDQAPDRMRFLATIDRAAVALILWDELNLYDRAALIGPWGTYLDSVDATR